MMRSRLLLLVGVLGTPALAHAGDTNYAVTADPAKATPGAKGSASVVLTGRNGWHLNTEAPISVKLTPGAGVTLEKAKLTRADAAEQSKELARFNVPFTAAEAGPKTIAGDVSFVICQESACQPIKEKITLALDVSAAAVPAGKAKKK